MKNCFFNGNIQGYRYLFNRSIYAGSYCNKSSYVFEKRDLIEFMKHRYPFEKMKSNEIHEV